ncbi:uncharacterized protein AMSG_06359 [Thecamonas trahens ATCC 50062]|uniref:Uncharacterized protein n=1 Tax=Thecamonas trahens ATCC 50062 TaxID=461836 RepID=A0A0L0DFV6_THETB|nr:hypothetical protein AMSG_06359 [Thecamonas trahens ATCC 50062]KNC50213.1 hypothetical protein AMSG_06359 [Thecamonas trahens ATCC 50062]|eukprot:XP_013757048.1 hypothetical protein AMSG_06359 [Thecamonas trahens ATCC 50062]
MSRHRRRTVLAAAAALVVWLALAAPAATCDPPYVFDPSSDGTTITAGNELDVTGKGVGITCSLDAPCTFTFVATHTSASPSTYPLVSTQSAVVSGMPFDFASHVFTFTAAGEYDIVVSVNSSESASCAGGVHPASAPRAIVVYPRPDGKPRLTGLRDVAVGEPIGLAVVNITGGSLPFVVEWWLSPWTGPTPPPSPPPTTITPSSSDLLLGSGVANTEAEARYTRPQLPSLASVQESALDAGAPTSFLAYATIENAEGGEAIFVAAQPAFITAYPRPTIAGAALATTKSVTSTPLTTVLPSLGTVSDAIWPINVTITVRDGSSIDSETTASVASQAELDSHSWAGVQLPSLPSTDIYIDIDIVSSPRIASIRQTLGPLETRAPFVTNLSFAAPIVDDGTGTFFTTLGANLTLDLSMTGGYPPYTVSNCQLRGRSASNPAEPPIVLVPNRSQPFATGASPVAITLGYPLSASLLSSTSGDTLVLYASCSAVDSVGYSRELNSTAPHELHAHPLALTPTVVFDTSVPVVLGVSTNVSTGSVIGGTAPFSVALRVEEIGGGGSGLAVAPLSHGGRFGGHADGPLITSGSATVFVTVRDAVGVDSRPPISRGPVTIIARPQGVLVPGVNGETTVSVPTPIRVVNVVGAATAAMHLTLTDTHRHLSVPLYDTPPPLLPVNEELGVIEAPHVFDESWLVNASAGTADVAGFLINNVGTTGAPLVTTALVINPYPRAAYALTSSERLHTSITPDSVLRDGLLFNATLNATGGTYPLRITAIIRNASEPLSTGVALEAPWLVSSPMADTSWVFGVRDTVWDALVMDNPSVCSLDARLGIRVEDAAGAVVEAMHAEAVTVFAPIRVNTSFTMAYLDLELNYVASGGAPPAELRWTLHQPTSDGSAPTDAQQESTPLRSGAVALDFAFGRQTIAQLAPELAADPGRLVVQYVLVDANGMALMSRQQAVMGRLLPSDYIVNRKLSTLGFVLLILLGLCCCICCIILVLLALARRERARKAKGAVLDSESTPASSLAGTEPIGTLPPPLSPRGTPRDMVYVPPLPPKGAASLAPTPRATTRLPPTPSPRLPPLPTSHSSDLGDTSGSSSSTGSSSSSSWEAPEDANSQLSSSPSSPSSSSPSAMPLPHALPQTATTGSASSSSLSSSSSSSSSSSVSELEMRLVAPPPELVGKPPVVPPKMPMRPTTAPVGRQQSVRRRSRNLSTSPIANRPGDIAELETTPEREPSPIITPNELREQEQFVSESVPNFRHADEADASAGIREATGGMLGSDELDTLDQMTSMAGMDEVWAAHLGIAGSGSTGRRTPDALSMHARVPAVVRRHSRSGSAFGSRTSSLASLASLASVADAAGVTDGNLRRGQARVLERTNSVADYLPSSGE